MRAIEKKLLQVEVWVNRRADGGGTVYGNEVVSLCEGLECPVQRGSAITLRIQITRLWL